MRPQVSYARSGDVHIAYQRVGDSGRDLVFVPGFAYHLDIAWEEPSLARFLRQEPRPGDRDQPADIRTLDATLTQLLDQGQPDVLGEILRLQPITGAQPQEVAVHVGKKSAVEVAELLGRHDRRSR